jgi:hypothetical protein
VENGAKIINNSWGGYSYLQSLADAILYAAEQGVVVVCAAGNSNTSLPMYPASYPGAISIAATDADDNRAYFSNYGASVDLAAPGVNILSLRGADSSLSSGITISNKYAVLSGTSMASPHAAGAFSLLYALYPGLDPYIYQRVMQNAANTNFYAQPANTNFAGRLGTGRIDVHAALTYSATNLFVTARPLNVGSYGFRPLPGSTNLMNLRVATWLTGVSNATVQAVALTPDVSLNTTNLVVGVVPGTTVLAFSNHFAVLVSTNAPAGSSQSVRFTTLINGVPAESYTLNFGVFRGDVMGFALTDPIDGQRDVIGWGSADIGRYSPAGETRWTITEGGNFYNIQGGSVLGDVNGNGRQEIAYWHGTFFGGSAYVSLVDIDGQSLSGWPKSLGYSVHRVMMADVTGNGQDDVVVLYSSTANNGRLRAYNGAGSTLWTYTIGNVGSFLRMMSMGDIDGDGVNEIIVGSSSGTLHVVNAANGATNRILTIPGHTVSELREVRSGRPGWRRHRRNRRGRQRHRLHHHEPARGGWKRQPPRRLAGLRPRQQQRLGHPRSPVRRLRWRWPCWKFFSLMVPPGASRVGIIAAKPFSRSPSRIPGSAAAWSSPISMVMPRPTSPISPTTVTMSPPV